jgi:hypothetical protein
MRTPRTKMRRKEDKKGILRLTKTTQTPPKSSDSCTQEDNENNNQQNLRILLLHFTNYNSESNPFPQTHKSKRRQNKPHQSLQILAQKETTTTTKNSRFFFYTSETTILKTTQFRKRSNPFTKSNRDSNRNQNREPKRLGDFEICVDAKCKGI